jgi:solute carrier family 25 folate transporter 32
MTLTGSTALDQSLAGFLAGACSTTLLHPLDLIKVRLQVNASPSTHLLPALKSISTQFGLKALYRGLTPNLAGSTLSWGIYFGIYDLIKKNLRQKTGQDRLSAGHHLLASAEAGERQLLIEKKYSLSK